MNLKERADIQTAIPEWETYAGFIEYIKSKVQDRLSLSKDDVIWYDHIRTRWLSWNELLDISEPVSKYKRTWDANGYIWDTISWWVFNMLDIESGEKINTGQVRWRRVNVGAMKLYDIYSWAPLRLQQIVNRIFAPYIGMTRIIQLRQWKKNRYVSTDIYHKAGRPVNGYQIWSPKHIHTLLRTIYQYICCDSDHHDGHNMFEGLIFDLDFMWAQFLRYDSVSDSWSLWFSTISEEQKKEITEILYFFREYVTKSCYECIESLKKEEKDLWLLQWKKRKELWYIIAFLEFMLYRTKRLTAFAMIQWSEKKYRDHAYRNAFEIDMLLSLMYTEKK